ncbi:MULTISPECIES: exonuclease domain-containing protein [unclassified Olleya]|jgi:DNA polymerase-3 subunit epsilon|uniref:exonuclease domain-containing protein n=1 Tax=unclassified Olleya TaxID=2615019 RepID=UPI0011A0973C|nr:exonuclease domain-containing protein [Olleya sp. Hel_I_94]TVZ46930.1 DNA polymerase-3 subunit epsilon [Olleya sp. Hel_I_94]
MIYTIIDVETSGSKNKITEISIFKYDGTQVIDEFTSLVNPEVYIPDFITSLTGIDNATVADAPTFAEVANAILAITEGTTFVAHNVNFDYNVIRNEFKALGIEFNRKKLCTVRLSRKLLPGHKSYSLGKLCKSLNINIVDRHRARGDAEATVVLFEMLLNQEETEKVFAEFLKKSSKEATLPSHLPTTVFNNLPNSAGIYYFKNKKGQIIYIGKAKDIKKRVLSHFYSKAQKSLDLCRNTADIDFELSGSGIIALLMEDAAIKQHYPEYNVVSKRTPKAYAIFNYEDRQGITHLAFNTLKATPNPIETFSNITDCRQYLELLCTKFSLCPKFCHLQDGVAQCSHYKITTCKGVCANEENVTNYNLRVTLAIDYINNNKENVVLKQQGRHSQEEAFVLIKNGIYLGYGFIDKSEQVNNPEDLETFLIPQKDNLDVWKILRTVLK